ncbi:MAG: phosphoribosylglycinamide formyltransferase [Proteobacteria bacterium]|nr:phosphoribosylglycinamide formyltransferase [Pseudomonadota bacterium]
MRKPRSTCSTSVAKQPRLLVRSAKARTALSSTSDPLRLAILISGRGSNMATIARECLERRINARVAVVISNKPGVAGLPTAQQMGLRTQVVPSSGVGREDFEKALTATLDEHAPDLVILAGFMRVLTAPFVRHYSGRMINIHPSLLPKYTGLHTHQRVLDAGDTEHGATVHFVTPELDGGPLILQSRVPVKTADSEATLAARVQATEHVIYPRVIAWIADKRLDWNGGRPLLDGKHLTQPVVEDFP